MFIRMTLGAALLVSALTEGVNSHSFYPKECCSDYDCAPADRVDVISNEFLAVSSVHGVALVPASMPRRDSADHRVHICMSKDYVTGGMKPLCLFIPPTN